MIYFSLGICQVAKPIYQSLIIIYAHILHTLFFYGGLCEVCNSIVGSFSIVYCHMLAYTIITADYVYATLGNAI